MEAIYSIKPDAVKQPNRFALGLCEAEVKEDQAKP